MTTIDDYIAGFPTAVQKLLQRMRQTVRKHAPDASETINYGIPTFQLDGNLVHFAAFPTHIGFYPTPSAITHFQKELSSYESAKGSVKFPLTAPIPFELIAEIVKFRVAENVARSQAKKKPSHPTPKNRSGTNVLVKSIPVKRVSVKDGTAKSITAKNKKPVRKTRSSKQATPTKPSNAAGKSRVSKKTGSTKPTGAVKKKK